MYTRREEFKREATFRPTLYAITQNKTNHKTLQFKPIFKKPITFDSIYKCRDFKRNYTNSSALIRKRQILFPVYTKNYPSDVQFDKNLIKIFTLDIDKVTAEKVS